MIFTTNYTLAAYNQRKFASSTINGDLTLTLAKDDF